MPNPTNGVRGGSSKRSDQKKNLEASSLDSQASSRRSIEELQDHIDVLAHSSGALQRLADIAKFFGSPSITDAMQMVENDYGAEIAKENTIRELTKNLELVVHVKSEEKEKLRQDNEQLMAEREKYQGETKKALDRQKKVEDQHALVEASWKKENEQKLQEEKAKGKKELKIKKAEIEEEYKKKGQELDERLSKLLTANEELKQSCVEAEEKLEKEKTRNARVEKSLEDDNKKLTEELKQLQAQFPVEEQAIEY